MPTITGIVPCPDRPGFVVILVDGRPFATVPAKEADHFSLSEDAKPSAPAESAQKTYDRALNLLSFRARSAKELKKRLLEKGEPAAEVDAAIERLLANGLLDDARYAEARARSGIMGKARSRRRIEQDLAQRGVSRELANQAISQVMEDAGTDECEVAERAARKKLRSLAKLDAFEKKKKLYAYLARQAYAPDVIRKVMRKVLDAAPEESDEG